MIEEIWKDVEGYEGKYQVSNFGRIIKKTEKNPFFEFVEVTPTLKKLNGDVLVILFGEHKQEIVPICKLVAETFIMKPKGCFKIKHINNNIEDNRATNLKWVKSK